MGAFGAALIARERYDESYKSTLASAEGLKNLKPELKVTRCGRCSNNCLLTINKFADGGRFISGNRCEKGEGKIPSPVNCLIFTSINIREYLIMSPFRPRKQREGL